jgi:glutathione peroxidase
MSLLGKPIARLDGTPATVGELTGGGPALLVNVASRCGLTPQYTALEALHEKYRDRGFTVVGIPCNQFGGQEPGTAEEIAHFCATSYGTSFPMTEKVDVNGGSRHPVYDELVAAEDAEGWSGDVRWNFEKFLIDGSGAVVGRFAPTVVPDDSRVIDAIESVLARLPAS